MSASHLLRDLRPSLHLELRPFTSRDIRRLAESMAGPLPIEAIEVVERLAEGSPFMTRAILQGLVESGALVASSSGWKVEQLAMADVQSSRHAAAFLVRRMELLPSDVVTLLSAAAVLGKEFDLGFAATLAGQSPAQAIAALDEARRRHIVWASTRKPHAHSPTISFVKLSSIDSARPRVKNFIGKRPCTLKTKTSHASLNLPTTLMRPAKASMLCLMLSPLPKRAAPSTPWRSLNNNTGLLGAASGMLMMPRNTASRKDSGMC